MRNKGIGVFFISNAIKRLISFCLIHNKFGFNAKSLDCVDVDERPPLIMKLANAQHHTQFLATYLWKSH